MAHLKDLGADRIGTFCERSMIKFCEGYSMMFDKPFECDLTAMEPLTAEELKNHFGPIIAINEIMCEGTAEGSFFIVMDRKGLFILGGATIMLPNQRIIENCDSGNVEDAEQMADAVGEIGNLLVGELSITFRTGYDDAEGLGDNQRLKMKLPVLVGEVTVDPEEGIELYILMTFVMEMKGFDKFKMHIALPVAE